MSITLSHASKLIRVAITTHQKPIPINLYLKEFTVQQEESLLNPFFKFQKLYLSQGRFYTSICTDNLHIGYLWLMKHFLCKEKRSKNLELLSGFEPNTP